MSWEISLLYIFGWNVILFWQKDPIKVPNFRRLISPNLYLDSLLLLKKYKISAKKVQRSSVLWHWRLMQNFKKNWLVFQNWKEFGGFWFEHSNISKVYTLIGPFLEKYVIFDLKKYRWVIFHDTRERYKIWRKNDLWFGK